MWKQLGILIARWLGREVLELARAKMAERAAATANPPAVDSLDATGAPRDARAKTIDFLDRIAQPHRAGAVTISRADAAAMRDELRRWPPPGVVDHHDY